MASPFFCHRLLEQVGAELGVGVHLLQPAVLALKLAESNARLASATVVLPWMISSTKADFRRAVQRLISSSITTLIGFSSGK
jgi:hypothetical protein